MYQLVMLFLVVYSICHLQREKLIYYNQVQGREVGLQPHGGMHRTWEMLKGPRMNNQDQIKDSETMTFVSLDLDNSLGLEIVNKAEMHKHQATGD